MRGCVARRVAAIGSSIFFVIAPAEAHHPVGAGNTGSAGPINTISASTLAEGQISAAVRYELNRLDQVDDAALLAAASQGKHAHSIRSIESVSLSAAYGITSDLTIAVRFPHVRRSDIREAAEEHGADHGGGMHIGGMHMGGAHMTAR
jgi:hypothetical protein